MNLDEIIDRELKRAFGFSDDRQCLFTFGDFRRLLMEIEDAAKRERDRQGSIVSSALNAALGEGKITIYKEVNAKKMHEALQKIVSLTNSLDEDCAVDPVEIRDIARDALSESSVG